MPELLPEGLPERHSRSRFDFTAWADGQAWKFTRGEDYSSSAESFRYNVRRWAKAHGYDVELRPIHALDRDGRELPVSKTEPAGVAVRFVAPDAGAVSGSGARDGTTAGK